MEQLDIQKALCKELNAPFVHFNKMMKVGVSPRLKDTEAYPVNGLRHPVGGDTTGWYIWVGEYSTDPDFFVPIHVKHLETWRPEVLKFLGLPPGYRFLLGEDGYQDVWKDETLLNREV